MRRDWVFLNGVTGNSDGNEYNIPNISPQITIGISLSTSPTVAATPVTYTIYFECKGTTGDYDVMGVWDEKNMDLVTSATQTAGTFFTAELTAKQYFRVRAANVTNGTLTVHGKVAE